MRKTYPFLTKAEAARLEQFAASKGKGGKWKAAKALGVNRSTFSRILHGAHGPSPMLRKALERRKIIIP